MKSCTLALFLLASSATFAQSRVEPTIMVLYPNKLVASEEIQEELKTYETEFEITEDDKKKFVPPGLTANWKMTREKELAFRTKQDFLSNLTLAVQTNLIYKIIEYHSQPLIFPERESTHGGLKDYKAIADKHEVSWLVNFVHVDLYKNGDKKFLKTRIQLYNSVRGMIHLNKEYVVSADQHGETNCEEDSWNCTIENLVPLALTDLLHELERNRRYWHKDVSGKW